MTVSGTDSPDQLAAAKFLIKQGNKVDHVSKRGSTALLQSICGASAEFTSFLLKQGADPNRQTDVGTPLVFCVDQSKPRHAQILLEAGADPTQVAKKANDNDYVGKTPLEVAIEVGDRKLASILKAAESGKPRRGAGKSKKAKITSVAESWKRIESALARDYPAIRKSLKKGANEKALSKLEKQIGNKLPDDVRASLSKYNGQKDYQCIYSTSSHGDFFLLSTTEIASDWKVWKELVQMGEFDSQISRPDKGVSNDWFNLGWIPLFSNGGGDSVCVDLAPAKGGKKGQMILMDHESSARKRLASSFKEFLSHVADKVEDGNLE